MGRQEFGAGSWSTRLSAVSEAVGVFCVIRNGRQACPLTRALLQSEVLVPLTQSRPQNAEFVL